MAEHEHAPNHPEPGSVWLNTKNQHLYEIIGPALFTEETINDRELVLYKRVDGTEKTVYARPLSEFWGHRMHEGHPVKRFVRVP